MADSSKYRVEPFESVGYAGSARPYTVKVNGETLRRAWPNSHLPRRFKDSFSASIAGSRYVDEFLRPKVQQSDAVTSGGAVDG